MLKYKPIGRKGGFSYRSIAKILDIEVGMKVTQETVSKWYRNEEKKKKKR
jgi:intein-encoded DNA endonuclease-like protein